MFSRANLLRRGPLAALAAAATTVAVGYSVTSTERGRAGVASLRVALSNMPRAMTVTSLAEAQTTTTATETSGATCTSRAECTSCDKKKKQQQQQQQHERAVTADGVDHTPKRDTEWLLSLMPDARDVTKQLLSSSAVPTTVTSTSPDGTVTTTTTSASAPPPAPSPMFQRMLRIVASLQDSITNEADAIEKSAGSDARFVEEAWARPNSGGGGRSRVLQHGAVFEKAGVHVSAVHGRLPPAAVRAMSSEHSEIEAAVRRLKEKHGADFEPHFFATGVSLIMHPRNPFAPTVHLNYRYFEVSAGGAANGGDDEPAVWWFGGGADLTPHYLFEEDAVHFHRTLRAACDKHDASFYPRFKTWADRYFYIPHRGEHRGIGGIFFDDLCDRPQEQLAAFVADAGAAFNGAYFPIVERRKDTPYGETHRRWQELRHGRYAEFNLVYDRGTQFGLRTPGSKVTSILSSLPLTCRFEWKELDDLVPGSPEAQCIEVLKNPREWAA